MDTQRNSFNHVLGNMEAFRMANVDPSHQIYQVSFLLRTSAFILVSVIICRKRRRAVDALSSIFHKAVILVEFYVFVVTFNCLTIA